MKNIKVSVKTCSSLSKKVRLFLHIFGGLLGLNNFRVTAPKLNALLLMASNVNEKAYFVKYLVHFKCVHCLPA